MAERDASTAASLRDDALPVVAEALHYFGAHHATSPRHAAWVALDEVMGPHNIEGATEVRPSEPLAGSQAGLSGPSGSPTSPRPIHVAHDGLGSGVVAERDASTAARDRLSLERTRARLKVEAAREQTYPVCLTSRQCLALVEVVQIVKDRRGRFFTELVRNHEERTLDALLEAFDD